MLLCLEREDESVSTEFAEDDMGLAVQSRVYGSDRLDRCRQRPAEGRSAVHSL